jgi:phosphotransferase system HPr-like phosphotransfer protein
MKTSFTEVITEQDFLRLAQEHSQSFLSLYNFLDGPKKSFTRKFYAHLIEESEELESFLDDHCARDNKTWYFFGELVACIRNLAKVAFILKHILHRYPAYELKDENADNLVENAQDVSQFLDETILSLYEEIKKESSRLDIAFPRGSFKENLFKEVYPQKRLPHTIDEEDDFDSQKILAKVASQYLTAIEKFEDFGWDHGKGDVDDLRSFIPNKVNEERSREIIALIHNLQSTYDHHIRHTPLESQDQALKSFRSFISMPMHLLDVVNWLSHLYQRHIHTAGRSKSRRELSTVIDESKILDIMINFALFHAGRYLLIGKKLALEVLEKHTQIDTCEVRVPERLGFHLRPATLVAKLARYYGTKLSLIVDGEEFDASNVLSIAMAAGLIAKKGYKTVVFRGDRRVLQDLRLLSEHNYGEDEEGNPTTLPPEFSHL